MLAAVAVTSDPQNPLAGLEVREHPDPTPPPGWVAVTMRAASLNHHDLWTLRGVGIDPSRLPIVLGCDAAGVTDDGQEVVIHAVVGDPSAGSGDETLDPSMSLLSERYDGTFAERVAVPVTNLVPKPASLSWAEAACLPTAYLTAYRMLFTRARLRPGDRVLVQGAGGGVATAAVLLGKAAGLVVWVTSRDGTRRERALSLGADAAFEPGARLPDRVDAVMETVGAATWEHSLKSVRPGGAVVVSGATSGHLPPTDLRRLFFRQIQVLGSTMGTRAELGALVRLVETAGLRPLVDTEFALRDARAGFERLSAGDVFGKIVLTHAG